VEIEMKNPRAFWPNGARLVISVSMQFEAGAQPERGAIETQSKTERGEQP
jgi:hypothetical protein